MAQWKETLEPYIKVNERIKTTTIVPTAGEDLIIGATLISDSGPSYPVLITSQREFLNVFASQEITKGYLNSLNDFYNDGTDTKSDVASTMWLNAYRLAGSTNMLIVRATKGADMNYVVPLGNDQSRYIVRDGQLLKQVTGFSLTIDRLGNNAASRNETGWAISINEIGIIGNLVGDNGPIYEYFAADLRELVEYLNGTSKFFCPNPIYYVLDDNQWTDVTDKENIKPDSVYFKEVYLAQHFIDVDGFNRFYVENTEGLGTAGITAGSNGDNYGTKSDGLAYLLATATEKPTVSLNLISDTIIDLNGPSYSDATGSYPDEGYLVNTFNSNSDIKVRIRRFNHDAVVLRDDIKPTVIAGGDSPFEVLTDVIDQYDSTTNETAIKRIKERDFYEVAVLDPSLDKDPLSFCVGNYPGRGDITLDELNDSLKMINIHISSLEDLNLSYYRGDGDSGSNLPEAPEGYRWEKATEESDGISNKLRSGNVIIVNENVDADNAGLGQLASDYLFIPKSSLGSYTTYYMGLEIIVDGSNSSLNNVIMINEPGVYELSGQTNAGTINLRVDSSGGVLGNIIPIEEENNNNNSGQGDPIQQRDTVAINTFEDNSLLYINVGNNKKYFISEDDNGTRKLKGISNGGFTFRAERTRGIEGVSENVSVTTTEQPDTTVLNFSIEASCINLTYPTNNHLTSGALLSIDGILGDEEQDIISAIGEKSANESHVLSCQVKGKNIRRDSINNYTYYKLVYARINEGINNYSTEERTEIYKDLSIDIHSTDILTVTPNDLMRSISAITEDEVYTTEGLTDLGNTDLSFQTYLCNMAKNENYFYPISTLYSTNYLAIANYRSRLAQDSYKLYTSAPWDIDSGTVGFKFHACPSVIYWEAVSRNRSMNREFASVFGFSSNGQVLYTNPVTEFTKKQRQLLLSKRVNTVMWNTQNQTWNMNDCYTMTSENHILNEDGNSRLFIRINKAIPTLLRPLIGRKLNNSTYADAETILKYWFERTILTMQYSVSDYKVTIANLEANDDQARRQNKMYVLVECLFPRSLKYIIVYSDALDMGMEFTGEIV